MADWPDPHVALPTGYSGEVVVVATEYHAEAWSAVSEPPMSFELRPEDDNAYDPNAVAVLLDGRRVGYLSAYQAGRYAPILRSLAGRGPLLIEGRAELRGGDWWAWVFLPTADALRSWANAQQGEPE